MFVFLLRYILGIVMVLEDIIIHLPFFYKLINNQLRYNHLYLFLILKIKYIQTVEHDLSA